MMTDSTAVPRSWLDYLILVDLDGTRPSLVVNAGQVRAPERLAALARAPSLMQSVALLAWGIERWPWAAPCVVVPRGAASEAQALPVVVDFNYRLAACRLGDDIALPSLPTLRDLFLARRSPSAGQLARYVARRLGVALLEQPLCDQFVLSAGGDALLKRSPATYSRVFAKYGSLNARDWRRLASLLRWFTTGPQGIDMSHVTEVRLCRRYLSAPPNLVRHRFFAWEHVVEVALSVNGYLPRGS